ncbi:venom acid phosphatase Acph-1 [Orussus abietinus]|uniref:venom acid phosphatase Acph-1 n=1 Tax=Orussus abietinus TaxID=222816 RepID=UPI0006258A7A|nr:venom acid phosphatase Acph-1 [Orussus abietinus]
MELYFISVIFAILPYCRSELKLLQVLFRHGARTPDEEVPKMYYLKDPYINMTYFPAGFGGLTNAGKMMEYELGEFFRERYGSFLGPIYSSDFVTFQSSNKERTKMSAQLVAAGLYPPSEIQKWHPDLPWQPIPIRSESLNSDLLFLGFQICPNVQRIRHEALHTDEHLLAHTKNLTEFDRFMSMNTGVNATGVKNAVLYEHLYAQMSLGLELPAWTRTIFPNGKLNEVASFEHVIQSYTKPLKRANGGMWVEEWLKNIDDHLNDTLSFQRKAHFYCGHDLNIAALLIVLNVFQLHMPQYASAIMFELHKESDEYLIKTIYKNGGDIEELIIPECGKLMCPLSTFRQLYADLLKDDAQRICHGTPIAKINVPD